MRCSLTQSLGLQWRKCLVAVLLCGIGFSLLSGAVFAKPLYSYRDDQGTNVITDRYDRIPAQYRARATTVEQESEPPGVTNLFKGANNPIGEATINVPGLSPYQSHILTMAGALALLCFALRNFSRSQVLRFLSLWGLIMLGLAIPPFLYFSQHGPLDVLRGEASHIQTKQQEHLRHAQ